MANTRRRVNLRHTLGEIPYHHHTTTESPFDRPHILAETFVDSPINNIQIPLSYLTPQQLSPDEQIIQLRGRRKISWSPHHDHPLMSPLKTPTKKMSAMQLRSSPRKRLMSEFNDSNPGVTPEKQRCNTPIKCSSTAKKIRFDDIASTSRLNPEIPLSKLLKGMTSAQLMGIILDTVRKEPHLDEEIRLLMPVPDLKPMEERLNQLKRNITKSLPKTRLVSKTDGMAFSRATLHVEAFKKCIFEQSKTLADSSHWDSLLDYVQMAWAYVKATPIWDNPAHNSSRRLCFKQLISHAMNALQFGGVYLGEKRLKDFKLRLRSMSIDCDDTEKCVSEVEALLQKAYINFTE